LTRFFGEKNLQQNPTFISSLFKMKILGKKICDKLSGPYSKKPPGSLGEGVQGRSRWGVPGGYALDVKEKPPVRSGIFLSGGTSEAPHQPGEQFHVFVDRASLASLLRLYFKKAGPFTTLFLQK
jgi:hypothetical protein